MKRIKEEVRKIALNLRKRGVLAVGLFGSLDIHVKSRENSKQALGLCYCNLIWGGVKLLQEKRPGDI